MSLHHKNPGTVDLIYKVFKLPLVEEDTVLRDTALFKGLSFGCLQWSRNIFFITGVQVCITGAVYLYLGMVDDYIINIVTERANVPVNVPLTLERRSGLQP